MVRIFKKILSVKYSRDLRRSLAKINADSFHKNNRRQENNEAHYTSN
jgi:hypothetical protein